MKRWICLLLAGCMLLLSACVGAAPAAEPMLSAPPTIPPSETTAKKRELRLSVTQMLADSPMFTQLCERFEDERGYRLSVSVNPDRVAVSVAETGKYDLLIARSGTEASRFVTAGYGTQSLRWIRDAFVLVGPADDPAGVSDAQTLTQAFIRIAKAACAFVSCYDNSDLSRAESELWKDAGIVIGNGRAWYIAARCSALDALQRADEENAYFLCTREGFLQMKDRLSLRILLQNAAQTENVYCIIPVDPDMFDGVQTQGVEDWIAYVRSQQVRDWIASYGTDSYGSPIYDSIDEFGRYTEDG